MKKTLLLCAMAINSVAIADIGPLYVSYPGYCNVKKIFVTNSGDIYGAETNCSASIGEPLVGSITKTGEVAISRAGQYACMDTYSTAGTLKGACSNGSSISYAPTATYKVQANQLASDQPVRYIVSSTPPDMDALKNLPPLR